MGIIVFTRMDRPAEVVRKYGEFWMRADAERVWVEGWMHVSPRLTGDQELLVMSEEVKAIWADHAGRWKDKGNPDRQVSGLRRGAGVHPKAGPYVAYVGENLIVKITATGTRFTVKPGTDGFRIHGPGHAEAVSRVWLNMIGDRAEVRQAAIEARPKGLVLA